MPPRTQLETAAADVITLLKGIREYSNARIAVIGGLALWKYIPGGRTTEVFANLSGLVLLSMMLNSLSSYMQSIIKPNYRSIQQQELRLYLESSV